MGIRSLKLVNVRLSALQPVPREAALGPSRREERARPAAVPGASSVKDLPRTCSGRRAADPAVRSGTPVTPRTPGLVAPAASGTRADRPGPPLDSDPRPCPSRSGLGAPAPSLGLPGCFCVRVERRAWGEGEGGAEARGGRGRERKEVGGQRGRPRSLPKFLTSIEWPPPPGSEDQDSRLFDTANLRPFPTLGEGKFAWLGGHHL